MSSYSQRVLLGYSTRNGGTTRPRPAPSNEGPQPTKEGLFTSPLSPYLLSSSMRTGSGGYAPLQQRAVNRLANIGGGGLKWPPSGYPKTRFERRAIRRLFGKWPLGFALFLAADKIFPPGFPGFDNITAVWRNPAQEPLGFSPGDFVPNPFDHRGFWGPPWVALLDSNTCALPAGCQFWGDFPGSDPTAPGSPDPFQPVPAPIPFRFDEMSPMTQRGPHPLAQSLTRRFATVNRKEDFVSRPPPEFPLGPVSAGDVEPAVVQKPPHTRNRPRRSNRTEPEVKLSNRVAIILTRFFDWEEIVTIMDDIVKILREPDYRIIWKGGSKWFVRNRKVARIAKLLGKEVIEDLVIKAIKPKSPFDDRWLFR